MSCFQGAQICTYQHLPLITLGSANSNISLGRWEAEIQASFRVSSPSLGLHGSASSCCVSLTECMSNTLSGNQTGEKSETKTCSKKFQGLSLLLKEGLKMFQWKKLHNVLEVLEGHLTDLLRAMVCGKKQSRSLQAYSKLLFWWESTELQNKNTVSFHEWWRRGLLLHLGGWRVCVT